MMKPWHEIAAAAQAESAHHPSAVVTVAVRPANDAGPIPVVRGPRVKSAKDAYAVSWVSRTPQVIQCKCGCARLRTRIPLGWVGCGADWICADCRRDASDKL